MKNLTLGITIVLTVSLAGLYWIYRQEERRLLQEISPYLTPSAQRDYERRFLPTRIGMARRAQRVLGNLRKTTWSTTISGFKENEDEPTPIFELDLGNGQRVWGCTLGSSKSGSCAAGQYFDAQAKKDPEKQVRQPFVVHLNSDQSYVETLHRVPLMMGASSAVEVRGNLVMNGNRAKVTNAALVIPEPRPGYRPQEVPTDNFIIGQTSILRASRSWAFDVSYDMPPVLAPIFDNDEQLTVLRVEGIVQVDLSSLRAGYRAEGRLTVLNTVFGQASISYYPDDFASIYTQHLSVPMPFPGLCFNLNEALAEIDFKQQRLRLGGSMTMRTAESLTCGRHGQEMGYFTKNFVTYMLEDVRSTLGLPSTIDARGHFVVDLDDGIVCGDASIYGVSVLHAAYLSREEQLRMWAPRSFSVDEVNLENILSSTVEIGAKLAFADPSFHRTAGWQCWPGDKGPRTDFESLLP